MDSSGKTENYSLSDELYREINRLPENIEFEIEKTVSMIKKFSCKRVAIQMPEGILKYAHALSDTLKYLTGAEIITLGDIVYGACCVDDYKAIAMGCDLLVHYGHSCLVPINFTGVRTLYVFVDVRIRVEDITRLILKHFSTRKIALVGIVQFVRCLAEAKTQLAGVDVEVPRTRPLSSGEVLGCTSPRLRNRDLIFYVGDGRFHLESMMMANKEIEAFKYDPYTRKLTRESLDYKLLKTLRSIQVERSRSAKKIGIVLSTLGRQGNPKIVERIVEATKVPYMVVLMTEITPEKLKRFNVDAWVHVSCPRLSIDWGESFEVPLLTPYEYLNRDAWEHPMDYYALEENSYKNNYLAEVMKELNRRKEKS